MVQAPTSPLSSLCKAIWRHWTYRMPVRYMLCVWVRLSIFSQLSIIQYMGLCVFSIPVSIVMIERIYTLSSDHHQIGSMSYYPLFRVRSWNNGMRCMSLYILIKATFSSHHASFLQRSDSISIGQGGIMPYTIFKGDMPIYTYAIIIQHIVK